jgi:glycosyltransferase involved in cell wall biosynthesis
MITVLMPAHKYHEWLEPAIESVLNSETDFRFELIVLANNMSDKDLLKLEEFSLGKKFRVLKLGNQSLSQSLNEGLIQSEYELIARFDSDDYMHRDRLQIQATFLLEHPTVSVLASGVKLINALGENTGSRIPPLTHREIKHALRYGNCLVHPSIMYRRASVLQVGGYTDDYSYAEDFDLYTRMIDEFEFEAVKMQLTSYRVFPDQISSKNSEIQLSSSIQILKQISKQENRIAATKRKLNISVLKLRQKRFEHGTGSLSLATLIGLNLLFSPIATFHFMKYSMRNFHR